MLASVNVGILLASLVAAILSTQLASYQMQSYGWRLGFMGSAILFFLGFYFRLKVAESPLFDRMRDASKRNQQPIKQLVKFNKLALLRSALFM